MNYYNLLHISLVIIFKFYVCYEETIIDTIHYFIML